MAIDWSEIYKDYKGKWLAFKDDETTVVGFGDSLREAHDCAVANGYKNPILTAVPEEVVSFVATPRQSGAGGSRATLTRHFQARKLLALASFFPRDKFQMPQFDRRKAITAANVQAAWEAVKDGETALFWRHWQRGRLTGSAPPGDVARSDDENTEGRTSPSAPPAGYFLLAVV